MASTSTQTSSSSLGALPPRNHDVFLSFSGETRNNFTSHLYSALERNAIGTFIDDKLERGEIIGPELLETIENSRVSVIVLSKDYACSKWCLDELVKILECKRTLKQIVLPVFFNIDPSDVRALRGFEEAFAIHERSYEAGKVERWRAGLREAGYLSGWHLKNVAGGCESKVIEIIVKYILHRLNPPFSNVAAYPVGIEPRVQRIKMMLSLGSDEVHMIGILGISGIGKTTIVKAVYNEICYKFDGSSFLSDVGEISKQPNGLVDLQKGLLSDILKISISELPNIRSVDQGIEVIKKQRRSSKSKRVLIVLDNVDNRNQLDALVIIRRWRKWLHSGSRIIITTRDESLLKGLNVHEVYEPELLTKVESLQLFSLHTFGEDQPIKDYLELSEKVVGYAKGIPLVLKVLGSFLLDKSIPEWINELDKLQVIPHDEIVKKLRISYDSLDDKDKELFLEIACFFVGMEKYYTINILEDCGLFPEIGIKVLTSRCLVRINESNQLTMHDMVRDMGREIVRRKNLREPWKRNRLCFHEDVLDVLTNPMETEASVEGLVLNLSSSEDFQVNTQAFAKMKRLRLLKLSGVCPRGIRYEHLSKRLRWLYWFACPLKSIPPNLFMENVIAIDMRYSSLKKVWTGRKILNKLKFLYLSHSYHLTETPDFSGLANLERLLLNDCTSLVKVHSSIECLDKLAVLDFKNCRSLRNLPPGIWKLTSLQNLSLHGCSKLEKLPTFEGSLSKQWFSIFLSWVPLRFSLFSCIPPVRNPVTFSSTFAQGLRNLDLADCNLLNVPDELGSLSSLQILNLEGNNFWTLPASIGLLSKLLFLRLCECTNLRFLPMLPASLIVVVARHCPRLDSIPIGNHSTSFERISNESYVLAPKVSTFFGCHNLVDNNHESNFGSHLESRLDNQVIEQGLSTICDFNISLPDVGLPDWMECESVGSGLSFVVPNCANFQGWALCVFYTIHRDERVKGYYLPFFCTIKNKTKGFEKRYKPAAVHEYPVSDYVWLHHVPQPCLELEMKAGDEVEFSVSVVNPLFHVKKCGIQMLADHCTVEVQSLSRFSNKDEPVSTLEGLWDLPHEIVSQMPSSSSQSKRKRWADETSGRRKRPIEEHQATESAPIVLQSSTLRL